ncbi:hypothetical protein [Nannocystis pusilla]|uniref:hypothetical protein n=1 Tax=Nannocystis pusilla TaxID=889268 RepID=UPI003B7D7774
MLFACGPDKQSSTDASTGGPSTSGTSQTVTSGSTTTSDAPTTSSSTSTDPAPDTEAASTTETTGTTGTTSTDGTSSTSTSGALPVEDCEEQLDQVDCEAILGRSGHSDCVWVETVAQWSRDGGCDVSAGPSRCVQGRYVGDGCFGSGCPELERVYIRDLGDGTFEIVNNPGGTCGVEPDGWEQCLDENPESPAPCSCVC